MFAGNNETTRLDRADILSFAPNVFETIKAITGTNIPHRRGTSKR